MSDLVTGDAVVVELRPAKLPTRALAFCIDFLVMGTVYGLATIAVFRGVTLDGMAEAAVFLALFVLVFGGYPVTVETLTRGRSLGKAALGLRVVREDGGPIRFRQALARGLTGVAVDFYGVSGFTGVIAVITSLCSPRGRRVGDMLAGTVVVRERAPEHRPLQLAMPPALVSWAGSAEASRLPDDLALRVRQFLGRVGELDPAHRERLATALAGQVSAVVSPPPPPGTPPEAFLTAALLVRRRREHPAAAQAAPETAQDGFVLPH